MEYYKILLPLALILFVSKSLGIFSKKMGIPQVIGMLLAGVVIGLIKYIPDQGILTESVLDGLSFIAKIGVVLIMFSAGLETNVKQIKETGAASLVITILGVVTPMGLGFVVAALFNGGFVGMSQEQLLTNLFYGVILTATSVSITVTTLKELGKLNTKVGASIISAAIIDDIIGIIVLSVVIGMKDTGSASDALRVILMTGLFFIAAIGVGLLVRLIFKWLDKKWPHNRRVPIFSLAVCFFFAYAAEHWFGVADITGSYIAGLVLSSIHSKEYIDRKIDINCYMVFGPVFFANIGLNATLTGISANMLWFGLAYVGVAIIGKLVGCGAGAFMCKFNFKDSLRVGLGMMVRAEVVLVCTQKGVENGLVDSAITPFVLLLILLTSFMTPMFLRLTYRNELTLPPISGTGGNDSPHNECNGSIGGCNA